jgi:hypothetical protein
MMHVPPATESAWLHASFDGVKRQQSAERILSHLLELANRSNGQARGVTKKALAARFHFDKKTAVNALHWLAEAGLVSIRADFTTRGQQLANVFTVLAPWFLRAFRAAELAATLPESESRLAGGAPAGPLPTNPPTSDPDPPPRTRTSTRDNSTIAEYWRKLDATRWR